MTTSQVNDSLFSDGSDFWKERGVLIATLRLLPWRITFQYALRNAYLFFDSFHLKLY